jgi:hypothetical protein
VSEREIVERTQQEIVRCLEAWRDRQPTPTLKLVADNAVNFVRRLKVDEEEVGRYVLPPERGPVSRRRS